MSKQKGTTSNDEKYEINPETYRWTYHAMRTLFNVLKLTVKCPGAESSWKTGQIFIFNNFARFESFIPQYLIYDKTGHFSKSIATKELFNDDIFSRYLIEIGGVPNDAAGLMNRDSKEILNNHKIITFP